MTACDMRRAGIGCMERRTEVSGIAPWVHVTEVGEAGGTAATVGVLALGAMVLLGATWGTREPSHGRGRHR